ncbi:MAG: hypothetical protein P0Y52_14315 [Candidatus Brevundimonas phytovorans]|nr:hypothetical protein [Brevundimonas sp.]WEK57699.1 MAG: hypothetical protein P0Y52_14315 [Brevundimonas sp.]
MGRNRLGATAAVTDTDWVEDGIAVPLWWQWPCEQMAWSSGSEGRSPPSSATDAAGWAGSSSTAHAAASKVGIRTKTATNSAKSAAVTPYLFADRTMPPNSTVQENSNEHLVPR